MSMTTVGETLQNNDCTFEQRQADIALAEKQEAKRRKEEKDSPYDDFSQMNLNVDCGKARRQLIMTNPSAYAIFDFLMEKADRYNAVMCSGRVIQEALGLSEATVFRSINMLKEKKFISIKKSGKANVYLLNKQLVWKSWGKNFRYAEFGAKIILAESEQEKPTKTKRMNVVEVKE